MTTAATFATRTANSGRWVRALMALFVFTTALAPGIFVNKAVFLGLLVFLLWDLLIDPMPVRLQPLAPLAVFAIFVYGFVLSFVNTVDRDLANQYLSGSAVLFLVYLLHRNRIDLVRLCDVAGLLILAGTALYWASIFLPGMPLGGAIFDFFNKYNFSGAAMRDFFDEGGTSSVALGTTPLLFVPFCESTLRLLGPGRRWRDMLFLTGILVAILVSASRGLIAICAAFFLLAALARMRLPARLIWALALTGMVLIGVQLLTSQSQVLSSDEISNAVKLGHFKSFLDDLTVPSGLFGRGLGSFYYSSGSGVLKANTELTPIDMVRYLGFPLALVLYALLLFPVRSMRAYGDHALHVAAFVLFIGLSFTNPVMFNSMGSLIVLWYWSRLMDAAHRRTPSPA